MSKQESDQLTEPYDDLSPRQRQILEYIRQVSRERNYPPSVREIGQAVGLSSSSTVQNHLNQLERRGYVRRDASKSRTIEVARDEEVERLRRRAVPVPIIGSVAAGNPILAEENIEDHLILSPDLAEEGCFFLRVRGDSMINAGIFSGDLVLVRPQKEAPNGSIVVAMIDGEATVKRLDRQRDHIRLLPENPDYEPIVTREAELIGSVRAVLRML